MYTSLSHRGAQVALASLASLWLAGCESPGSEVTSPTPPAAEATRLSDETSFAASLATTLGGPVAGLSSDEVARFEAGKEEFSELEEVDEGLGPVFNEAGCIVCHDNPVGGTNFRLETRFGRVDTSPWSRIRAIFDPLANLGGSLIQDRGIGLVHTPKGSFNFVAEVVPRRANVVAKRLTTPLFGLGLVDAIPDEALLRLARLQAANSPETRGTPHMVTEIRTGRLRVGRFGWKSQVPTLFQFSGDAYLNEMGITSPEFPDENCPQGDCALLKYNPVSTLNDEGDGVVLFTDFMTLLGPPPRGRTSRQTEAGKGIFAAIGCGNCHTPEWVTGTSPIRALSRQTFQPFSDFLLHDMGSLGDGIVQGNATGRQMRTAPLWGVSTRQLLLHDGRATSLEAAIRAHDGQGRRASNRFAELNGEARRSLMAFLNSL